MSKWKKTFNNKEDGDRHDSKSRFSWVFSVEEVRGSGRTTCKTNTMQHVKKWSINTLRSSQDVGCRARAFRSEISALGPQLVQVETKVERLSSSQLG